MEEGKEGVFLTIDETLYFERGQEIDEMITISLDPDITLQMYEQYIQIRGIVLLQGEYRKYDQQQYIPNTERENAIFIEKVVNKNAQEAKFKHRFPLDIHIPNERVKNMNDIEINIDAFDYELPDIQTMKIEASLHIQGLQEDIQKQEEVEVEEEMGKAEEIEKVNKAESTAKEMEEAKQTDENEENIVQQEVEEVNASEELEVSKELEHNQTSQSAEEKDRNDSDDIIPSNENHKDQEQLKEERDKNSADVNEIVPKTDDATQEMAIQLNESEEVDEGETAQDVQFLTDLFGGDEEETSTTIKLYIIQNDDTIESIAKKYEVPTIELIKDNQLNGEDLYEGQLIQIPSMK